MKDYIAANCGTSRIDFGYDELASKGQLQKSQGTLDRALDGWMQEINEERVA